MYTSSHAKDVLKHKDHWLQTIGIQKKNIYWQSSPATLVNHAIKNKEGVLADNGALVCNTGKFKGRSPKDRYFVKDTITENTIAWKNGNHAVTPHVFDSLYQRMIQWINTHVENSLYIRDALVCTHPRYQMSLRVVNAHAWHHLFCHHLFIRPSAAQLFSFLPEITLIHLPDFVADPSKDGLHNANFTIINITKKIILIAGTAYAGEMKKSVFTLLNYLLPKNHAVLPMHCAANVSQKDEKNTALFFGLSGTGKTTLSTAQDRQLIGDDEHGWAEDGIFNFEGGCYAKVFGLTPEREPEIDRAIRFGTVLENTTFFPETQKVHYADADNTENTRAAYPLAHLSNVYSKEKACMPRNIFFLTCDAHGLLPPISLLKKEQILFYFILGYTSKVAGTEEGIITPKITFSACFGAPFLPLPPLQYAEMFVKKVEKYQSKVWMINTGWTRGAYGQRGYRVPLAYSRDMISAVLNDQLRFDQFKNSSVFDLLIPSVCPGVPTELLCPVWSDVQQYHMAATGLFQKMQAKYEAMIQ